MKNSGAKFLIAFFMLVQIVAPVQAMMASPVAISSEHKDHCHMNSRTSNAQHSTIDIKSCAKHCMTVDQSANTNDSKPSGKCDGDSSCMTNCSDCSHSTPMVLNVLLFMHQAVSHSPIQTSYDLYKYYPPLKLRPPRV